VAVLTPLQAVPGQPTNQNQQGLDQPTNENLFVPDQAIKENLFGSGLAEPFPPTARPLGQEAFQHFPNSRLVLSTNRQNSQKGGSIRDENNESNSNIGSNKSNGTAEFENFPARRPERVRNPAHMKNKLRKKRPRPATEVPETVTKTNQNKMRSSTQRNEGGGIHSVTTRVIARPSPNFHPITESTTSITLAAQPQARPNVPISETEFPPILPDRQEQEDETPTTISTEDKRLNSITDTENDSEEKVHRSKLPNPKLSVLANNNDGVWFLEEKIPDSVTTSPFKRDFFNRTEERKVRPSKNGFINDEDNKAVSIVETSKKGEREQNFGKTFESTTFSTSRVEIHKSTTPAPITGQDIDEIQQDGEPAVFKAKEVLKGIRSKIGSKQEAGNDNIIVNNKGTSSNSLDLEVLPNKQSAFEEVKHEEDLEEVKHEEDLEEVKHDEDLEDDVKEKSTAPVIEASKPTQKQESQRFPSKKRKENSEENLTRASESEETSSTTLEKAETRSNNNDHEIEIDLDEEDKIERLIRTRRRKLRQRAKALLNAMDTSNKQNEPFVVLPMHQVDPTISINVDQMFDPKLHPGVKRISAYDFEGMLSNGNSNATISLSDNHIADITRPVSELKTSIEGLANSMKLLSSSVKESTTEKILSSGGLEESQSTILHLQDEIVKLTRVLESLKPPAIQAQDIEMSTRREDILESNNDADDDFGDKSLQDQDGFPSDPVKSEMKKPLKHSGESIKVFPARPENPEDLQIIEVFNPSPSGSTWFTSTPSVLANKIRPNEGKSFFLVFK